LFPTPGFARPKAAALAAGPLPAIVYRSAVNAFGEEATAELIYLVGLYCMVSTTLNGFNVPLPEGEDI
jgi:hypothetical protein